MSHSELSGTRAQGAAVARAAEAMLRSLGGATVLLRFPNARVNGPVNGLGLEQVSVREIEAAPVIVREVHDGEYEALFSAASLAIAAEVVGGAPADALRLALALVHHDRVLRLSEVTVEEFAGVPYLLRAKATE